MNHQLQPQINMKKAKIPLRSIFVADVGPLLRTASSWKRSIATGTRIVWSVHAASVALEKLGLPCTPKPAWFSANEIIWGETIVCNCFSLKPQMLGAIFMAFY